MNHHYQALMRAATELTRIGQLREATDLIQRALKGDHQDIDNDISSQVDSPSESVVESTHHKVRTHSVSILDSDGIEIEIAEQTTTQSGEVEVSAGKVGAGKFIEGRHSHAALARDYKLYLPPDLPPDRPANLLSDLPLDKANGHASHGGRKRPLVVMLHGCTQDANDFSVGTGMNEYARQQGFFVLYPEQSQQANPSRCWNWFKHNHQRRGSGEPALLASLTLQVIQQYDLDPQRVYIAGLSAGGAMAAIMADAYPDIYAAVGIHSGLATGVATNVSEAMSAMKNGRAQSQAIHKTRLDLKHESTAVATIVFHGDRDTTVHPGNGDQVLQAALTKASDGGRLNGSRSDGGRSDGIDSSRDSVRIEKGISSKGKNYTRTIHCNQAGKARAEHWLIHGAGHAWSGGQSAGSYTDPTGPDATREMLRFFLAQTPGLN